MGVSCLLSLGLVFLIHKLAEVLCAMVQGENGLWSQKYWSQKSEPSYAKPATTTFLLGLLYRLNEVMQVSSLGKFLLL